MPKVIESPVKRFAGQVVLPDYLTFPQYRAFDNAMTAANKPGLDRAKRNEAMVPGVLAVVKEWRLANVTPEQLTPETFPASPYIAVTHLLGWLVRAITTLVFEVDDSPNA